MSYSPYPLAGKLLTGALRSKRSVARFFVGKSPCQELHCGVVSLYVAAPQTNSAPESPPRAANSHSASVGRRLPAHDAYAAASSHETCTTG